MPSKIGSAPNNNKKVVPRLVQHEIIQTKPLLTKMTLAAQLVFDRFSFRWDLGTDHLRPDQTSNHEGGEFFEIDDRRSGSV